MFLCVTFRVTLNMTRIPVSCSILMSLMPWRLCDCSCVVPSIEEARRAGWWPLGDR